MNPVWLIASTNKMYALEATRVLNYSPGCKLGHRLAADLFLKFGIETEEGACWYILFILLVGQCRGLALLTIQKPDITHYLDFQQRSISNLILVCITDTTWNYYGNYGKLPHLLNDCETILSKKLNKYRHLHMITDLDEILSAGGKLSRKCLFFSLPLFHSHNHSLYGFI